MGPRLTIAGVSMLLLLAGYSTVRTQQNPYRLKEPDQKKTCVACHSDFEATLKKRFVHSVVRAGECSGCHDPHVSSHGKLLADDAGRICASCHADVIPANARSVHQVVADGACAKCHDPHASDHPGNLVATGAALCVGCHNELGESVKKARFKHSPVEKGCTSCHDPHGSSQSPHLLKTAVPAVCVGCHKPDAPAFVSRHLRYPVEKASCTSCHDPHGSNQSALLYDSVHRPVADRACTQCHAAPDSATPFATTQAGYELCKRCHGDMVTATMAKARLHWPVADANGCASCHNPHASNHDKLLKAGTANLCGSCHADMMRAFAGAKVKHAPATEGQCVTCHSPHGANGLHLVDQPSVVELCTSCHDYEKHSAHPIGPEAVDPRNKNLQVGCLSCHKAHGTDFKWMLLTSTTLELCTQCHQRFGR